MALSGLEEPLVSLGLHGEDKKGTDDSKPADMGSIVTVDKSAVDSQEKGGAAGSSGVIADFVTMGMFIIGEYIG